MAASRNGLSRRFFFFKQKTAYERRISDWSSDVCSSDLLQIRRQRRGFGYWLWKPFIIADAMDSVPDGTILMYTDAAVVYQADAAPLQIGRAACRERVCQYV